MCHGKLPDRVADQNGSPDLLAAQLSVCCHLVRRSPPSMYPIWDGTGYWCVAGAVHPLPPARAQTRPGFESKPAGLRREGRFAASHRLCGRASDRAREAAMPAAVAVARCGWLIGRALVVNRMPRLSAQTTAIARCQRPPRCRTRTGVLAGPARDMVGKGRPLALGERTTEPSHRQPQVRRPAVIRPAPTCDSGSGPASSTANTPALRVLTSRPPDPHAWSAASTRSTVTPAS